MGTNVRVGFGQRMAGQGILMLLIVLALSGFAPVADPGGQILLNLIGVASCLVGVGIFVFTMRAIDAPLGERAAYWFGAYTHYQHGTVGRFHAAKNSLAFVLPGGMFAFLMFKGLN